MNRGTWIKRAVATFLVVLMSIESIAAVVGDNDGAAFITKAEFESLKNNFQTQINRYNTSLDNKIDGAIASYIAGITVGKTDSLKHLVPNYADMMWVNNFQLFGRWRKWTSNTAKTENLVDGWFVPSLNEKRLALRAGSVLDLYDPLYSNDGYGVIVISLNPTRLSHGLTVGKRNGEGDGHVASHVPTLFVRLVKPDGEDHWYPDARPLWNAWTLMNTQYIKPHGVSGPGDWYLLRGKEAFWDPNFIPPVEWLPVTGTDRVYNLQFHWAYGTTTSIQYSRTSVAQPKFSDFMFPWIWVQDEAFNGSTNFLYDELQNYNNTALINTFDYFYRGVTYQALSGGDNRIKMINYFLNMMLGKDNNTLVNAGYVSKNNGPQSYDFSIATESVIGEFEVIQANFSNPKYKDKGTTVGRIDNTWVATTSVIANLSLPVWPTLKLADINSNYFKYEKSPLTKGQGLPIAKDILSNGVLHINATYETNRIISTYTTTGIEVDVADRAFTENNLKYLEGYDDDVDPNRTTSVIKSLHNLQVDNTAKTLKLSIPVKKDDNVWLRIAPATLDGGYYAKLKDLKVTLVSE